MAVLLMIVADWLDLFVVDGAFLLTGFVFYGLPTLGILYGTSGYFRTNRQAHLYRGTWVGLLGIWVSLMALMFGRIIFTHLRY